MNESLTPIFDELNAAWKDGWRPEYGEPVPAEEVSDEPT